MAAQLNNTLNLKQGDVIRLTYYNGQTKNIKVTRVTDKNWFGTTGGRNSFGTLEAYFKNAGDIVNCEIIRL